MKFLRSVGALNILNSPYDLHCLGLIIYTKCTILNAFVRYLDDQTILEELHDLC